MKKKSILKLFAVVNALFWVSILFMYKGGYFSNQGSKNEKIEHNQKMQSKSKLKEKKSNKVVSGEKPSTSESQEKKAKKVTKEMESEANFFNEEVSISKDSLNKLRMFSSKTIILSEPLKIDYFKNENYPFKKPTVLTDTAKNKKAKM